MNHSVTNYSANKMGMIRHKRNLDYCSFIPVRLPAAGIHSTYNFQSGCP